MLQFFTEQMEAIRSSFPSPRTEHGSLPPLVLTHLPFQLIPYQSRPRLAELSPWLGQLLHLCFHFLTCKAKVIRLPVFQMLARKIKYQIYVNTHT